MNTNPPLTINRREVIYPSFIEERLTPHLELEGPSEIGEVSLWFNSFPSDLCKHPYKPLPTGYGIYGILLPDQVSYLPKPGDLINRCFALADLIFYEKNPHLVPAEWNKQQLWVYAWKSVGRNAGRLYAPALSCVGSRPRIRWSNLESYWEANEPAGMHGKQLLIPVI